jgi:hypothetical protein
MRAPRVSRELACALAAIALTTGVSSSLRGCSRPISPVERASLAARQDPCGTGAPTLLGRETLYRTPYLQNFESTLGHVAWAGLPTPGQTVVVAALEGGAPRVVARARGIPAMPADVAARERARFYARLAQGEEIDPEHYFLLVARIDGLDPGTRYCHRLESPGGPLTHWASMRTPPSHGTGARGRFVVLGDSGNGSNEQRELARRIESLDLDMILFASDIAYPDGAHDELQSRFFDVYDSVFRRVPVYAAIGNHERESPGAQPFERSLVLPGNERFYSLDWGDVHFIVLDTTHIGAAQAAWLERDLAANTRAIRVVLGHHPPVTSARRGPSRAYLEWFVPILERHRVELVLSGHEHHYERSIPIRGVTYVVTGGGGADLYPVGSSWHTARARSVHHFVLIDVEGSRLTSSAIDISGRVFDRFTIGR